MAGEAGDDLDEVVGHLGDEVGLLAHQRDLAGDLERVVRADLGPEPVLERGDDPPAVRVVLGVRAGHEHDVQRQAQRVAAHLDVALLHDVEQRDLDALGEVGQLVDRHDAAVRARHEAVVDGLGVAQAAALGDLDGVDVADEVGDGGVRGGQLLGVALGAVPPGDRQVVALVGDAATARGRDRLAGVLADLGAGDHRRPLVEQGHEAAQQARLALPALAEQHDVVPGEHRALELREHGAVEPDDPRPRVRAGAQPGEEVVAQFGTDALGRRRRVAAARELTGGGGEICRSGRGAHSSTLRPRRRSGSSLRSETVPVRSAVPRWTGRPGSRCLSRPEHAGWFRPGPAPGARGPAVLVGRVDGDGRRGVFAGLADATAGDRITVRRRDGRRRSSPSRGPCRSPR